MSKAELMESRLQRAFQNRWVAGAITILAAYVAYWAMRPIVEDAYYTYYLYPRLKGGEYIYPELRYTFGQAAIFIWSAAGFATAVLTGRCVLFRTGTKWAVRSVVAFVLGFVLLVVGFIAGVAMRDLGF